MVVTFFFRPSAGPPPSYPWFGIHPLLWWTLQVSYRTACQSQVQGKQEWERRRGGTWEKLEESRKSQARDCVYVYWTYRTHSPGSWPSFPSSSWTLTLILDHSKWAKRTFSILLPQREPFDVFWFLFIAYYSLTSVVYEPPLILKLLVQPAGNSSSKPHQRKWSRPTLTSQGTQFSLPTSTMVWRSI